MHPIFRRFLSFPSSLLSFRQWVAFSGQKLILPFYHTVSDEHLPHVAPLYRYKNKKEFEKDLDTLLRHFKPVSLQEIHEKSVNGTAFSAPSFFLSFDDGLREVGEIVAPMLLRKGIPASIFVNPDFVGNKSLFFRYKAALLIDHLTRREKSLPVFPFLNGLVTKKQWQKWILSTHYKDTPQLEKLADLLEIDFQGFLQRTRPYLDLSELHSLKSKGFDIGGHSLDHPEYRFIPLEEQIRQTSESIQWVKDNSLGSIPAFAFPFTDFGVSNAFEKSFIKIDNAPVLLFGTAGIKREKNPLHIQRIAMEGTTLTASALLKTEFSAYQAKKIFGKELIKRDA